MNPNNVRTASFRLESLEARALFSAFTPVPTLTAAEFPPPFSADIADSLSASLPALLTNGTKLKARAVLKITNCSGRPITGPYNVTLLFSRDQVVDSSDTVVNFVPLHLKLKMGAKKTFNLKLIKVPPMADGTYFLLAKLERPGVPAQIVSTTREFVAGSPNASVARM